jgi:hypothetical protein
MAGNVVNLNKFRKKKAREAKAKQAEINRIRHGRTGAEKAQELADRQRAERLIEGKRLVHEDEPVGPTDASGASSDAPRDEPDE